MQNKILILILCGIMILGGFLRFYGADWGIPKPPYWRNHYQDEAFALGLLFKMGPDNLNPHYFINPTWHYYTILFALKIAAIANYTKHFSLPIETNKFGQPTAGVSVLDYSRMYQVGRFVVIAEGIILIFLMFLIGRNLYNKRVGVMTAAFTAILPTLAYQSHFLVVDAPAIFWLALAFFFLTVKIDFQKPLRWFIFAGIFMGIAIGTKYLNILILLPFLYRLYQQNKAKKATIIGRILNKYLFVSGSLAVIFFFLTTPYALLSFNEFLHGDAQEFGGIFGQRGLLNYNAYPLSFLSPFTLSTYHSLQLPLTLFALSGLIYLCYKRKTSDIFLLLFVVPFYLLLIYHASPHLRHILPVLPFLMIALARMFDDFMTHKKNRFIKPLTMVIAFLIFIYTLFFSLAFITRFTPVDTRIECADWVKVNVSKEAKIGIASYFPWNYTPPIETITKNIVATGYNYDNLLTTKPDYFIITENEYREFPYARESKYQCRKFVEKLFSQEQYMVVRVFKKDLEIWGIKFAPNFPNMDWNQVNPKIYVFAIRK